MIEVPFSKSPREAFDFIMNGRQVSVVVRYSNVSEVYSLDLIDRSVDPEVPLVQGVPLSVDVDILAPYRLGLGALVPFSTEQPGVDAALGELGSRVRIAYLTPEEVAAL